MGNTLQEDQKEQIKNNFKRNFRFPTPKGSQSSGRCSFADHLVDQNTPISTGRNVDNNQRHRSLEIKTKQKLSLSKDLNCQSQASFKMNRCSSIDSKGTLLNQNKHVPIILPNYIPNYTTHVRFTSVHPETIVKRTSIKPRELPRKISIQKVVILPQNRPIVVPFQPPRILEHRQDPPEPRIIITPPINHQNYQLNINYTKQPDTAQTQTSLQSSIVTPFVPAYLTPDPQEFVKKLKKVATMNRSFAQYSQMGENILQDNECNKENFKKKPDIIQHSLPIEQKITNYRNSGLFTDPNLYSYITNKQHPCVSRIQSKYAIPICQDQITVENPYASPIKMFRPNHALRLEDAVPQEVESKPMIEGDFDRFPTLSEESACSQTDNTSFIPIVRNNSSQRYGMEGEELLKFCRPKIDEQVMADLKKLPIRF